MKLKTWRPKYEKVKYKVIPQIYQNEIVISTLIMLYLKCEHQIELAAPILEYIEKTKIAIQEAQKVSIVNMFYM